MNDPDQTVPTRNRWYDGKRLDAWHMDLETAYHRRQRETVHRLVFGPGVLGGLNVTEVVGKPLTLKVSGGYALDGCGRLIVLPKDSHTLDVPEKQLPVEKESDVLQVRLRWTESESEPAAVASDVGCAPATCESDQIREGYEVFLRRDDGKPAHCPPACTSHADLVKKISGRTWASLQPPKDPSILLARVQLLKKKSEEGTEAKWRITLVSIDDRRIVPSLEDLGNCCRVAAPADYAADNIPDDDAYESPPATIIE